MNGFAARFATIVTVLVCVNLSIAHADLSDGLVGYYSFDDGTGDVLNELTGNGMDGELFNFETDGSQWVAGQMGGALAFDGVDDYVIAPESPLAETALSVSIWGYANEAPLWASLVKNWGQGVAGQFHFGLGPGDADTLNIFVNTVSEGAFNAGTDTDPIELETWEHYAFVADPDEQLVSLYRNGEQVDQRPYDGTFTDVPNSESIGIGVKTTDAGDMADTGPTCCAGYWNGMLDDLGIWHRALSAEEITDIYTRGMAGQSILDGGNVVGDFNGSGDLDEADINLLTAASAAGSNNPTYDLNADNLVNGTDVNVWIKDLKNSWIGDADVNGEFNSSDFVMVFTAGKYETGAAAVWNEGDWNGNGQFDSSDFVAAFADGGYENGPRAAVASVPEPSTAVLVLTGLLMVIGGRRRS